MAWNRKDQSASESTGSRTDTSKSGQRARDRTDKGKPRFSKVDHSQRSKPQTIELELISQPPGVVHLGTSVTASVLISVKIPPPTTIDVSSLIAAVSLVKENRNGHLDVMEAGTLTGQKMADSVRPIPQDVATVLSRRDPQRTVLGYFSFPELLIRQPGAYRIRITLLKADGTEVIILSTLDSELVVVRCCYRSAQYQLQMVLC